MCWTHEAICYSVSQWSENFLISIRNDAVMHTRAFYTSLRPRERAANRAGAALSSQVFCYSGLLVSGSLK